MRSLLAALLGAALVLSVARAAPLQDPHDGEPADNWGSWGWTGTGLCPHYCNCYKSDGLRRVDCVDRMLGSVDLGLPADTEIADLGYNIISTLDDGCFQVLGLVRLRDLGLQHNAIHSVGPWAFSGLRRLRRLDLSYNHLQTLHPSTFSGNKALKVLALAGNNFARLPVDRPLLVAPRLQVLDLSSCKLAHLGVAILSELPALASLNLSGNYLIQLQPQALEMQAQLQLLDLTHNPLACDLNSRKLTQQLQQPGGRNVTVRHPCPESPAPGLQLQSKHLARLMADVAPQGNREGSDLALVERSTAAPRPRHTHENILDLSDPENFVIPRLGPDSEALEEDFEASVDPTIDTQQEAELKRNCPHLFPERISRNPILFRGWFDPVPSFWASVVGCQAGIVLGLVLSSCICRMSFWRTLCRARGSANRVRGRRACPTSEECMDSSRPRRSRRGVDCVGSEGSTDALVDAGVDMAIYPWPSTVGGTSPPHRAASARPETPPPPYHELGNGNTG